MELDRAFVIDEQFISKVKANQLPGASQPSDYQSLQLTQADLIDLFDSQVISRQLDLIARRLKQKGLCYYTIGSSGHEGNAVIGKLSRITDMAFLHYRSAALVVQRLKQLTNVSPITDLLYSFCASSLDPISAGRHKVLGSLPGFIPPQTSTIASHLPKAVGAALSIVRAKELKINATLPSDAVILASFGDASLNHASTQASLNSAAWISHAGYPLPLVFICEDNGLGISVPTPNDWVKSSVSKRPSWHYIAANGLELLDVYQATQQALTIARTKRIPVFLHIKCVRLMGHAGSDIEQHYLTQQQIEETEGHDPLLYTAQLLLKTGTYHQQQIINHYQQCAEKITAQAEVAAHAAKLNNVAAITSSIVPSKRHPLPKKPTEQQRKAVFAEQYTQLNTPRNLCQQINQALTDLMLRYQNAVIFGEDVGKKGGVYRVTADLQRRFSKRRVFDSLLDETTILGTAIGLAHNGFLPVPEIQFLAYYHNAEDQIRGEAATLSFFSNGQFDNPMVVRIASFAYQKGFGGHFHNDNSLAAIRDLPGVVVCAPSNGADAVKLLRSCFALAERERRVVLFLEPIALYMVKDLHQARDNGWLSSYPAVDEQIEFGEVSSYGLGDDLVILTYANGYYLSRQAKKILQQQHGINIKVVDIHWLAPLPEQAILAAVEGYQKVLIVDECRKSGSVSEAIMTLLLERCRKLPQIKRLTAEDCFIPLGPAWHELLPSSESIVNAAVELVQENAISNVE